jgi:exodeoxyribonuclease V alpha subunit
LATHVSVRLFWHDSGWNGAICRDPIGNVWCEAHEHVRDNKPVEDEARTCGKPVDEAGVKPGCEMSLQAFSPRGNVIRVWPPDWMASWGVRAKDVATDSMSAPIWPFEEMWHEDGEHKPNDERRAIVERFLTEVEPGKSLAFFYVDERNPLLTDDEEHSPARVLVGISRIITVGDISEWQEPIADEYNMVWSVPFKHAFPDDGIRLPVQAILAAVPDRKQRAPYVVPLDGGIRTDFRYGSSRVALDRCVVVVERAISALARVEADGVLKQSVASELGWLNDRLLELWEDRGPYPGLASLLRDLGCDRAVEIQQRLSGLAAEGEDLAELVFSALDGDVHASLEEFVDDLEEAADEWGYMADEDRNVARLLVRMELSPSQIGAILRASDRVKHRLPEDANAILENPYRLSEEFVPDRSQEPIPFVTVDHALLPHESMAAPFERVHRRDPRRLRALLVDVLRAAADDGDTFVAADMALEEAAKNSPEDRRCDPPLERLGHERFEAVLGPVIERFDVEGRWFLGPRSQDRGGHQHADLAPGACRTRRRLAGNRRGTR